MNKITINVPPGIEYISQWGDYTLPQGKCIVDKGVTGCGYTEFCLRNNIPVVLCSPRKLLLENKREKHMKEGNVNVLYLENKNTGQEKNLENKNWSWSDEIRSHLAKCELLGLTPKFMVTYDSLKHVVEAFKDLGINFGGFCFVVDEFQSIFLDAFFKASTEFNFLEYLQDCPNALFLSATPMLEKYMKQVDEFKDLDFYYLDWSQTGSVENIKIVSKRITSIAGECQEIIKRYKAGIFPVILNSQGKPVESKEYIFYLNSVSDIIRTIKKAGLSPREVNIICSGDRDNQEKIKKMSYDLGYKTPGDRFEIGKVPLEDEPNKMFTFCTRSVYMGVDFFSKCASSGVFADPNIKCLALDISLDLPQIVGRQRDRENPFKNNITVFYKTNRREIPREEFDKEQEERLKTTEILLNFYNKGNSEEKAKYLKKLRSDIQVSQYSDDFVSISDKTGVPVHNKFIELAHERAWEVSQKDYQNSITVTKALESGGYQVGDYSDQVNFVIDEFRGAFEGTNLFEDKLRIFCGYLDKYKDIDSIFSGIRLYVKDPDYQKFYDFFGTKGCSSKKFRRGELEKEIVGSLKCYNYSLIYDAFKVGEKYTKSDAKRLLANIYTQIGLDRKAKASDLEEYFEIETVNIQNKETGKRDKGFKIISSKNKI